MIVSKSGQGFTLTKNVREVSSSTSRLLHRLSVSSTS